MFRTFRGVACRLPDVSRGDGAGAAAAGPQLRSVCQRRSLLQAAPTSPTHTLPPRTHDFTNTSSVQGCLVGRRLQQLQQQRNLSGSASPAFTTLNVSTVESLDRSLANGVRLRPPTAEADPNVWHQRRGSDALRERRRSCQGGHPT